MRRSIVLLFLCALAGAASHAQTVRIMGPSVLRGQKVVWILAGDGSLAAYGAKDFHLLSRSVSPLPSDARRHPDSISVARAGFVLFSEHGGNSGYPLFWSLWSNAGVRRLMGATSDRRPAKDGSVLVTRANPVPLLSADGRRLFWFESRLLVVERESLGEVSQSGEFLAWTSSLENRDWKSLVRIALPPCKCGTGVCEETCPIMDPWAPDAGITDFFFLTRWVPGQTSPDYLETDLYRNAYGNWRMSKLPEPVEQFLDATDHGNSYIAAIPDAGCCGWENESDNLTYLVRGGKRITFFDEWSRFHNKDYDVSFYTSKALVSPDATQIAYTIMATSRPGREIRLADRGKKNPEELRHIRDALAGLPRTEVVRIGRGAKPAFSLANAELVGWLDSQRLLIWRRGQLFVVDAKNGQTGNTGLKAEDAAHVFIR